MATKGIVFMGPICSGKSFYAAKLKTEIENKWANVTCIIVPMAKFVKELVGLSIFKSLWYILRYINGTFKERYKLWKLYKKCLKELGPVPSGKPRDHLVYMGHNARKINPLIWNNTYNAYVKTLPHDIVIMDDCRYIDDVKTLDRCISIKIEEDKEILEKRHQDLYNKPYPKFDAFYEELQDYKTDYICKHNLLNNDPFWKVTSQIIERLG